MFCILIYIIVLTFSFYYRFKLLKKFIYTLCKGGGQKISLEVQIFHPIPEILVPWGSKYFEISGPGVHFRGGGVQIFHDSTPRLRKTLGDLGRNMPYCQCTLPYGDCKGVMRVGCLPNCGELFADFWRPQRLVDMKSSNGALDDELWHDSQKL